MGTQFINNLWFVRKQEDLKDGEMKDSYSFQKYIASPTIEIQGHPVKADTKVDVELEVGNAVITGDQRVKSKMEVTVRTISPPSGTEQPSSLKSLIGFVNK